MRRLSQDVVFALRLLMKKPGFTAAALLSLVLGIGLNTAVFTLWDTLFLNPLPVADVDSLSTIDVVWRRDNGEYSGGPPRHAYPNFRDLAEQNRSFSGLAIHQWQRMNFSGGNEPERATGVFVSANFFELLGLKPALGRFFLPEEDTAGGAHPVVVLSFGTWTRLFGADPDVLGRQVTVNGESLTVIGVGPPGFRGIEITISGDFFVPVMMYPRIGAYPDWFEVRGVGIFQVVGRLQPGTTEAQATAELMRISQELEKTYGEYNDGLGALVKPILEGTFPIATERERHLGYGKTLGVAVALILLIACLNVANLLLVRGLERGREIALRQSLGADRRRLTSQLFTENILLFLAGGALSLPAGQFFLDLLWSYRPPEFAADVFSGRLDMRVFAFTLMVAVVTGLIFGLLPAIRASRADLVAGLKGQSSQASDRTEPWRWSPRRLLVTAQLALALLGLIFAGLYARSLKNAYRIDLGFDAESILVVSLAPGEQGFDEAGARELYRRILDEVRALPGVASAVLSENRVMRGGVRQHPVYVDGNPEPLQINGRQVHRTNAVTPGYFATTGIPLVAGKDFDSSHRADTRPVAIINETMARTVWLGEDPLGQYFTFDKPNAAPIEVIGVAKNSKYRNVHEPEQFFFYLPETQRFASSMTLHVRAENPAALLGPVREKIRALAPGLPLADARPLPEFVDDDLWLERASVSLLSVFSVLASALATLGIYGVLSQAVRQRRREIAIRRAVGARRKDVLRSILREGLQLITIGLAVGLALSVAVLKLTSSIEGQLFEVGVLDPITYTAAVGLLFLVALCGCLVPARHALHADPVAALRSE